MKNIEINNKKAFFDYFIEKEYEVGLVLEGKEVKAIREGKCNLKGSWCNIKDQEIYVEGMHISPYQDSNAVNNLVKTNPYRVRKLLMHKSEIRKLNSQVKEEGFTLVPLKIYFSCGKVKMLIGLCKGKHLYDKRDVLRKKDIERNDLRERY